MNTNEAETTGNNTRSKIWRISSPNKRRPRFGGTSQTAKQHKMCYQVLTVYYLVLTVYYHVLTVYYGALTVYYLVLTVYYLVRSVEASRANTIHCKIKL